MTRDPSTPPWWQIVLGVEVVLLMIALVMPITPSKTGSDWSLAELFFDAPTFGQEVLVYFVFSNVVVGLLAVVFLATRRKTGVARPRDEASGPDAPS